MKNPTKAQLNSFNEWFLKIRSELNLLIEPEKDWSSKECENGWTKLFNEAKANYSNGIESGAVNLAYFHSLYLDLNYLQKNSEDKFKYYRSILASKKSLDSSYLTSMRFEVSIACQLVKNNFEFSVPDPPDFLLKDTNIAMECYAPRVISETDIYKKTIKSLQNKENKYHYKEWFKEKINILIIDATWLIRSNDDKISSNNTSLPNDFTWALNEFGKKSNYDLTIAYIFGNTINYETDARVTSCIYTPYNISNLELKSFCDSFLADFKQKNVQVRLPDILNPP